MEKLFLTIGSIFFWFTSLGQVVKGKIVDESNFEMIGVNITSQDMLGTTSDYDGKYELKRCNRFGNRSCIGRKI